MANQDGAVPPMARVIAAVTSWARPLKRRLGPAALRALPYVPQPVRRWLSAQRATYHAATKVDPVAVTAMQAARPPAPESRVRLFVGPANFAGQGNLWARAAAKHIAGLEAISMAVDRGFQYPVDYRVNEQVYLHAVTWQTEQVSYVRTKFTHVLLEAQRPLFGSLYRSSAATEAQLLCGYGLHVATIAHGRDIRLPSRHRDLYPDSPYVTDDWDEVETLERQAAHNLAQLDDLQLPAFVSTPDLLDDLPRATWCPVVIDPLVWATDAEPMLRRRPVVVHAPTNAKFKGSDRADPIMTELHEAGVIDYRRVTGVPWAEMRRIIQSADIVLDQFRLGSYGVTACEAMAAGRVVVGHVADRNRERVRASGGTELPIVEATIDSLLETILQLLEHRDAAMAAAARGPEFVTKLHDGTESARVLASFLSVPA